MKNRQNPTVDVHGIDQLLNVANAFDALVTLIRGHRDAGLNFDGDELAQLIQPHVLKLKNIAEELEAVSGKEV